MSTSLQFRGFGPGYHCHETAGVRRVFQAAADSVRLEQAGEEADNADWYIMYLASALTEVLNQATPEDAPNDVREARLAAMLGQVERAARAHYLKRF